MSRGVKNRSLLRQLLNTAPELHMGIIAEATLKEEVLAGSEAAFHSSEKQSATKSPKLNEPKPFEYRFDDKGLVVPGFKWKVGEGNEKLTAYAEALKKLAEQIEEKLTSP